MPLAVKSLILLAACLTALWGWTQHRARSHEARAEAAFPPEGQIITVQGHPVHAVVMGKGPDLVLIHGASGNTRDLTFDLAPRLAQDYRVIVLDRPGLGYTPRINRTGATITQQAALLQEAAAQLGADKPIVLGHSYGGAVALAWAVTQPDHIAALVNIAGAAEPWDTGLSTYYRVLSHPVLGPLVIPLLTAFVPDSRVEKAVQEIFAPQEPPAGYMDHIGAGLTLRRHSLRANALQRANLLGEIEALHTRYAEISVPVEIVHGTADTTVGVSIHSEPLAAQVKDAHLTVLDGVGHMPHHSAPEAVVSAINRAATRAGLRPAD
ncbi:putative hydrolase or acyltransferase (alpha/beta hydrolase superfamily) [Roseovarius mucosus DSM 17069]|uniref:Putative hydrolase or acyltransferase (Alpha/beta hydrolase superfamily) n=1 Tax=Roseovarius mucosus DSM 17069 TaxID=1288298 RepID=A0A0A0HK35_9RHOB|nr:alpha/beta hydrolase [Roseovarius mucosus]KGM87261.1 putative hydrolase or acyltransferase (alpha/beta hydrolase superfamily) [Roseovarius mucosus DSM 17069]